MDTEALETLQAFAMSIPDEERLPLIVESPIWENTITPALGGVADLLIICAAKGTEGTLVVAPILRVLFDVLFVYGYREGAKQKRAPLTFICPEESTDE